MINIIKSIPNNKKIEELITKMKNKNNIQHLLNKEDLRSHAKEIVENMEGPEMSKLVNDHIVHTTKDFDERLKFLFKLFKICGFFEKEKKYRISEFFIRIEHQQRGAPHAHILLWMVHNETFIERHVFINGKETIIKENKPAPNFQNTVQGKFGDERESAIKSLQSLLMS